MAPPVKRSELIAALVVAGITIAVTIILLLTRHVPPVTPLSQPEPPPGTLANLPHVLHLDDKDKRRISVSNTLPATTQNPHMAKVVIKKAVYGDLPNGAQIDVTDKVAALVKDDAVSVDATNDNFTDPAFGITKKLKVDYTVDGKDQSKTVAEGETLSISGRDHPRLIVIKAVYGDLPIGSQVDVTDKVAAMVKDDALSVAATNDNFTDPASGIVKTLRVEYTFDGKEKSKVVNENDTLTITRLGE